MQRKTKIDRQIKKKLIEKGKGAVKEPAAEAKEFTNLVR